MRVGLERLQARLEAAGRVQLSGVGSALAVLQARLARVSPMRRVQDERQRLDSLAEGLARAIASLLGNAVERARLGKAGRLLVEKYYSEENSAADIRRMARDVTLPLFDQ